MAQEAPATAYLVMADMFRKSVWALLRDPPEPAVLLPTLFLIHHSIELYLKAYLSLTKEAGYNHNIVELFDECVQLGLICSDGKARYKIEKLKDANSGHYLRYLKWGDQKRVPGFLDYQVLLNALSNSIGPLVVRVEIGPKAAT